MAHSCSGFHWCTGATIDWVSVIHWRNFALGFMATLAHIVNGVQSLIGAIPALVSLQPWRRNGLLGFIVLLAHDVVGFQ
jgi:hypothetical protein